MLRVAAVGRKHTREEVEARLDEVEAAYSRGLLDTRFAKRLAERHGVNLRQIWADRRKVLERIRNAIDLEDATAAKVGLLARSRELYRHSLTLGHTSTAARCLSFEADVLGAKEPLRIEVETTVDDVNPVDMARRMLSPEALDWARATLLAAGEELPPLRFLTIEPEEVEE